MIPFFVVDRPISLSIVKGVSLPPGARIGILSQAVTTTDRFKRIFRAYPYQTDVMYSNGQPSDRTVQNRTLKMVDSGIFGRNGCHLKCSDLFAQYESMAADYGVIIDVMRDARATVESAREAMTEYRKKKRGFELVAVAQGKSADDYLRCYEQLRNLGYVHIAVGGLLQKRENTARYVNVRCARLMESVLRGVRKRFDPTWLFALGVLHPNRLELFEEVGVWGSDYKGWIFNYEKKDTVIELIQKGEVCKSCRIAARDLTVRHVKQLSEQELRFFLTRSCIERRVMDRLHRRRLLIVACSARKHRTRGPTKAWNLYDGTGFRVMKKAKRQRNFPGDIDILILSTEHGLISPSRRISYYDRRMNNTRADELNPQIIAKLTDILCSDQYREVLLWMGQDYLKTVTPISAWRRPDVAVRIARGRIGEKLRKLKDWLDE